MTKEIKIVFAYFVVLAILLFGATLAFADCTGCGDDGHQVCPIEKKHKHVTYMKEEHKNGLVNGPTVLNLMQNKKTETLQFGQAIIFNPFIIHGNIEFESKLARIAYNVRFQSYNKPLLQKNTDYLKYHKLN